MKVAALVSGGVDSAVALKLLMQQGHAVTAFYLKIWLEDELSFLGDCPWEEDLRYVRAVCEQLGVPLQIINLQREYWDTVVAYTIAQVKAGKTPNPDVLCNQAVKFGFFLDKIGTEFDKVASGHYAQVRCIDGVYQLHAAPDLIKDQTYFLARLSQEQLARLLFPIGHLIKKQVRELAHEFDLPNKDRKDSQGICFLGKLKFADFLKHHLGEQPGNIVEHETGTVLGQHKGFWYHTIGQRQGLGLAGGPWYVVSKDPATNRVFISRTYHAPDKTRNQLVTEPVHWLRNCTPSTLDNVSIKLRHGPQKHACSVRLDEHGCAHVQLVENDQGIAPGQFAVLYQGTECLGSGVIARSIS